MVGEIGESLSVMARVEGKKIHCAQHRLCVTGFPGSCRVGLLIGAGKPTSMHFVSYSTVTTWPSSILQFKTETITLTQKVKGLQADYIRYEKCIAEV
jgi:hypothetical protein